VSTTFDSHWFSIHQRVAVANQTKHHSLHIFHLRHMTCVCTLFFSWKRDERERRRKMNKSCFLTNLIDAREFSDSVSFLWFWHTITQFRQCQKRVSRKSSTRPTVLSPLVSYLWCHCFVTTVVPSVATKADPYSTKYHHSALSHRSQVWQAASWSWQSLQETVEVMTATTAVGRVWR
jgi:hypothetical protein